MEETISQERGKPILHRNRLTRLLGEVTARRLALVTAPGGYGKTTLLRQLVSELSHAAVAWVSLDQADANLSVFVGRLARAVIPHLPPGGLFELAPKPAAPGIAEVRGLARLMAHELEHHLEEHLIIVLDDLHHLDGLDEITAFLDAFIASLPSTVHLVAAGRSRPRLPLGRLQARGELIHLTADDLSMNPCEARQFLAFCLGLELPDELLTPLQEQTEGWAAALLLLGQLLRNRPESEWGQFLSGFPTGGPLYDFLAEEVLEQQPADLQEFLLSTSVLTILEPYLIERMLGVKGAGAILQRLDAQHLFTSPAPSRPGAYRYHHLFHSFLRQQLQARRGSEEAARLHRLAGHTYEQVGNLVEAVHHYLAGGDLTRALPLIAEQVDPLLKGLGHQTLMGWLVRIPEEIRESHPDVLYLRAQLASWLAQDEVLAALYQRCLDLYDERDDHRGLSRCLSAVTKRFWRLRNPYFRSAPERWAAHPDPDVSRYGRLLRALVLTEAGRWGDAFERLEALLTEMPASTRAYFDCLEALAVLSFWMGDSVSAIRYGVPHAAGRTAMGDFAWGIYIWIAHCMQADRLGLEAFHRQYTAMQVPPPMNRMHQMIGTLGQAFIHLYNQRWHEAQNCLEALRPHFNDGRSLLLTLGSEATFVAQEQLGRLYMRQGRRDEALVCLDRNLELAAGYPEVASVAHADMADFLARDGDLPGARAHLTRAFRAAALGLEGPSRISAEVAATRVAWAEGDRAGAFRALSRALSIAQKRRSPWYFLFVGGPELLPLLTELAQSPDALEQSPPDLYATLRLMGDEITPWLATAQTHADPAVREAATTILTRLDRRADQTVRPVVKVYSLGGLQVYRQDQLVESADWNRTKVRLLFLFLLMRRGKPIAKEWLTQVLWPGAAPATARTNLRATLHGLKRSLEPGLSSGSESRYVQSDRESVWLGGGEQIWFDLWAFDDLMARAKSLRRTGRAEEGMVLLQEACDLYRGSFLPELAFADYFQEVRTRVEQAGIEACLHLARSRLAAGETRRAIDWARRVLAADRTSEAAYRIMMEAYIARGERERAVQAYRTCRKQLLKSLGSEPSEETRRLIDLPRGGES